MFEVEAIVFALLSRQRTNVKSAPQKAFENR
jgi:hypothetical protein